MQTRGEGKRNAVKATQREAVAARYVLNPLKHYTNCVAHLQANLPQLIYIRLRPSAHDPHDVAVRVEKRVHRVEAPLEVVLRLEPHARRRVCEVLVKGGACWSH